MVVLKTSAMPVNYPQPCNICPLIYVLTVFYKKGVEILLYFGLPCQSYTIMKLLPAFILLLLCPGLRAQDTTLSNRIPSHAYTIVYNEPLALLDGFNGLSARFGVEHAWNSIWSLYGTGGVYFEQGYVARVGIKRFCGQDENHRYSLGIEYMHNWHIHTEHDYYRKPDPTEDYAPDDSRPLSFTEEKNNHVIDLTVNVDEFWRHHWVFQFYGGVGVKFKNAIIGVPDSTLEQLYHFHESMIEGVSATSGNYVLPDFRFGIRIGRVFYARKRDHDL
jgi:hypothetical protein